MYQAFYLWVILEFIGGVRKYFRGSLFYRKQNEVFIGYLVEIPVIAVIFIDSDRFREEFTPIMLPIFVP